MALPPAAKARSRGELGLERDSVCVWDNCGKTWLCVCVRTHARTCMHERPRMAGCLCPRSETPSCTHILKRQSSFCLTGKVSLISSTSSSSLISRKWIRSLLHSKGAIRYTHTDVFDAACHAVNCLLRKFKNGELSGKQKMCRFTYNNKYFLFMI